MFSQMTMKNEYTTDELLLIMKLLRSKDGCPWDREQNHQSIRNNLIEEAYEAIEAIDNGNKELLCEELGDVLLQVVFHSQMAEEDGAFDFNKVVSGLCKKLIERHPHVFGEIYVKNLDEVLSNWDEIKKKQKIQNTVTETLKAVPNVFPALMRAQKVQKRAAKVGFDWKDSKGAFEKVAEETRELIEASEESDKTHIEDELGDLLFSIVNVSRFLKVESEEALSKATDKFINRFELVEKLAKEQGINLEDASAQTLDELWNKAKITV